MNYLPPFETLKSYLTSLNVKGELMVSGIYEDLVQMIRRLIIAVEVNEAWYLERYRDIAEATIETRFNRRNCIFVNDGYFEGRMPFAIHVDESYYLAQNNGVADYVRKSNLASGQQHFDENGYAEGRLPFGL